MGFNNPNVIMINHYEYKLLDSRNSNYKSQENVCS